VRGANVNPIIFGLLCLLVFPAVVVCGALLERARKEEAERELGFWDANVLAALDGSAIT